MRAAATDACPRCARELTGAGDSCPSCGYGHARGDTVELLPEQPIEYPATVHQVHRRPFGIDPVPLLGGLSAVGALLAIVLFTTGAWITALVLLALSAGVIALFTTAVRREPDAPGSRFTLITVDRLRSLTRLAIVSARAWLSALPRLLLIWQRRRHLRRQLRRRLGPLGEAVYREDRARAAALKFEADEIERTLHEADEAAIAIVTAARRRIEDERGRTMRTEALSPHGSPDPVS